MSCCMPHYVLHATSPRAMLRARVERAWHVARRASRHTPKHSSPRGNGTRARARGNAIAAACARRYGTSRDEPLFPTAALPRTLIVLGTADIMCGTHDIQRIDYTCHGKPIMLGPATAGILADVPCAALYDRCALYAGTHSSSRWRRRCAKRARPSRSIMDSIRYAQRAHRYPKVRRAPGAVPRAEPSTHGILTGFSYYPVQPHCYALLHRPLGGLIELGAAHRRSALGAIVEFVCT